jgi:hypothetical protein
MWRRCTASVGWAMVVFQTVRKSRSPLLKLTNVIAGFNLSSGGGDFLTYRVDLLTDLARCRGKTGGTKNK